jgi:glycerol-3-phosphate dehydrogenase (NAD(P)+)
MTNLKIGVIGGGSWATAIVKILCNHQTNISWWLRNAEDRDHLRKFHHNPKYLTSVEFQPEKLSLTDSPEDVIRTSDLIVIAVPSAFCHSVLATLPSEIFHEKLVFSAVKGIIPEYNLIVGEYLHQQFHIPYANIGVITGPCHAEEVAMEKLSYLTLACLDIRNAELLSSAMRCRYIKVTTSDDIYGTEYSAVLKNVVAIAGGVSNAIQEIERLVAAVHPINRDIKASAYLGDLLVTAYSQFSRNRMFGTMIGKGYSVKMAQLEMNMIAEGYYAVKCIHEINRTLKVDMPITEAVYNILYERISPAIEIKLLCDKLS